MQRKTMNVTIRKLPKRLGNAGKRGYELFVEFPRSSFKPNIFAIFEVDNKYELLDYLGGGSFGMVCSARDKSTGDKVAIKKITDVFRHHDYTERVMREVLIHSQIHHPFIVGFREVMQPVDKHIFNDVYIVMEMINQSLDESITTPSKGVGSSRAAPLNVKLIMNQLFRAFQYLHCADVLHRNLKLNNIRLKDNEIVKICDFGYARIRAPRMTEMVIVDSYSPPELFLRHVSNQSNYGPAIDIWSLGCIFADLLLQRPLSLDFGGYSNDIDILKKIAQTIPPPNDDDLSEMIDNEKVRLIVKSLWPLTPSRPLSDIFVDVADKSAVDLLEKMLVFNPRKRISMADALEHEYMAEITVDVLARNLKLKPYQIEKLKGLNPPYIDMSVQNHSQSSKKILRKIMFNSCIESQAAQTLLNISTQSSKKILRKIMFNSCIESQAAQTLLNISSGEIGKLCVRELG